MCHVLNKHQHHTVALVAYSIHHPDAVLPLHLAGGHFRTQFERVHAGQLRIRLFHGIDQFAAVFGFFQILFKRDQIGARLLNHARA